MADKMRDSSDDGFYRIVLSPVALFIPIAGICAFFGDGMDWGAFPPFFAMGVVSLYILMGVAYVMLSGRKSLRVMAAISAIANGSLLMFLSEFLHAGTVLTCAGLFIMLAGLLLAITSLTPPGESLFARKIDNIVSKSVDISELKKILNSIQYPCVFLEKGPGGVEQIVAFNTRFVELSGFEDKSLRGAQIDAILPENQEDGKFKHENETWVVKRTAKGRQALLMLSPIQSKVPTKIEIFDSIDPITGLYVVGFMKHKARSDIESIIRGKRKLSVVLFRLSYQKNSAVEPSDDEKSLCNATFARIVIESIRVCDSAFKVSNNEVLLLMPDTPSLGADKVVMRIYSSMKKASGVECPSLSKARLEYAQRDFIGGTDLPQYDKLLDEMTITLNSSSASADVAISA
jgi:hypothetical protein